MKILILSGFPYIAGTVAHAAALRIAEFPTSNEFWDWNTAAHTFTFSNAVQQGLRPTPSFELRGVFRRGDERLPDPFLNVPPVRLPEPDGVRDRAAGERGQALLADLAAPLDRQQPVKEAGRLVAVYLYGGG